MDRRLNDRNPTQFPVRVTELQNPASSSAAQVSDISEYGVCVNLPFAITPGSAVRLNMMDSVMFGFVAYSEREGPLFRTGVEIEQVLIGGSGLSRLLGAALREAMPGKRGLEESSANAG
jgi:hypothetical protein